MDELEEVELLRHGGGGGLGRDATTDAVVVLRHTEGVVIALAGLATLRPQAVRMRPLRDDCPRPMDAPSYRRKSRV